MARRREARPSCEWSQDGERVWKGRVRKWIVRRGSKRVQKGRVRERITRGEWEIKRVQKGGVEWRGRETKRGERGDAGRSGGLTHTQRLFSNAPAAPYRAYSRI